MRRQVVLGMVPVLSVYQIVQTCINRRLHSANIVVSIVHIRVLVRIAIHGLVFVLVLHPSICIESRLGIPGGCVPHGSAYFI